MFGGPLGSVCCLWVSPYPISEFGSLLGPLTLFDLATTNMPTEKNSTRVALGRTEPANPPHSEVLAETPALSQVSLLPGRMSRAKKHLVSTGGFHLVMMGLISRGTRAASGIPPLGYHTTPSRQAVLWPSSATGSRRTGGSLLPPPPGSCGAYNSAGSSPTWSAITRLTGFRRVDCLLLLRIDDACTEYRKDVTNWFDAWRSEQSSSASRDAALHAHLWPRQEPAPTHSLLVKCLFTQSAPRPGHDNRDTFEDGYTCTPIQVPCAHKFSPWAFEGMVVTGKIRRPCDPACVSVSGEYPREQRVRQAQVRVHCSPGARP